MAVRVQTQDNLFFGVMTVERTATHIRISRDGVTLLTKPLSSPVTAREGEGLRLPSGLLDFVHATGPDGTDDYLRELVDSYWKQQLFTIDLLVDDINVIPDTGYDSQSYANWVINNE